MVQSYNSSRMHGAGSQRGRKCQPNKAYTYDRNHGYISFGRVMAPRIDYNIVVNAHTFTENSNYIEFAPELVYSSLAKHEEESAGEEIHLNDYDSAR